MKILIVLLIFISSISYGFASCVRHGLECPDYEVLESHESYEVRKYTAMKWVTADGNDELLIVVKLYGKLMHYFSGENREKIKIPKTFPIRVLWLDTRQGYKVKVSFMIPKSMAENTPVPTDPTVYIVSDPEKIYFVRTFTGYYLPDEEWSRQAAILKRAVAGRSDVDTSKFYRCSFDSPFNPFHRLNEDWMEGRRYIH